MLKSKKGIYILLPIVVFVWGALIYQLVDAFSDNEADIESSKAITFSEIKTVERELFKIGVIERDPFLGNLYISKKKDKKKVKTIRKKVVTWPSIKYKGLISGDHVSNAVFLIEINGIDQLLKRNQSFAGVKLIRGSSTAIKVKHKGYIKQYKILN